MLREGEAASSKNKHWRGRSASTSPVGDSTPGPGAVVNQTFAAPGPPGARRSMLGFYGSVGEPLT